MSQLVCREGPDELFKGRESQTEVDLPIMQDCCASRFDRAATTDARIRAEYRANRSRQIDGDPDR
jgi:hypothetical protein